MKPAVKYHQHSLTDKWNRTYLEVEFMRTQLSILVKKETLMSRMQSFLWFITIFKKTAVEVSIDGGAPQLLLANKDPYVFDVAPGYHEVTFVDPRAGGKQAYGKFTNLFLGFIFAVSTDGAIGASDFDDGGSTVRDGYLQCNLVEGDLLRVSARGTRKGGVKVKILKK